MSTRVLVFFAVLISSVALIYGCSSNQVVIDAQAIADATWKPDGSGMLALVEQANQADLAAGGSAVPQMFSVYPVDASGSIGADLGAPGTVNSGAVTTMFISSDGNTGLTALGIDIYRYDIRANTWSDLIHDAYLMGASPDLKYVVIIERTAIVKVYDISSSPVRLVSQITTVHFDNAQRALWLENGQFSLGFLDSTTRPYLRVYDTTGVEKVALSDAAAPFHSSAFAPGSHEMFIRTSAGGIDRINVLTYDRVNVVSANVSSMDVTRDGKGIAYILNEAGEPIHIQNVANGHQTTTGDNAIAVMIAPAGDKLAYIHFVDNYNEDIKVTGLSIPQ